MYLKIFLLLTLCYLGLNSSAQSNYATVPLDSPEDIKLAEAKVTEAATIILATPTNQDNREILEAQMFILRWMEKTEYSFTLNEQMINCCKKDDLFGIYLAALAKGQLSFESDFSLNAVKLFIAYVSNPKMEIKQTGAIKKLLKAKNDGNLSIYSNE